MMLMSPALEVPATVLPVEISIDPETPPLAAPVVIETEPEEKLEEDAIITSPEGASALLEPDKNSSAPPTEVSESPPDMVTAAPTPPMDVPGSISIEPALDELSPD
jgi:hypothetical protein